MLRNFGDRKIESDMGGVELDTSSRDPTEIDHALLQNIYLSSNFSLILSLRTSWSLGLSRFMDTICNDLSQVLTPLAMYNSDRLEFKKAKKRTC